MATPEKPIMLSLLALVLNWDGRFESCTVEEMAGTGTALTIALAFTFFTTINGIKMIIIVIDARHGNQYVQKLTDFCNGVNVLLLQIQGLLNISAVTNRMTTNEVQANKLSAVIICDMKYSFILAILE